MREKKCNIWILDGTHAIVIPTNMGWRGDGRNIMGAGLAKQAKKRCGDVSLIVGEFYRNYRRSWTHESMNMRPPVFSAVFKREGKGPDSSLVPISKEATKELGKYDWVEMIFVPTKKLIKPAYLSWKPNAELRIVRRSLRRLKKIKTLRSKIAIPLVGAGNGKLKEEAVVMSVRQLLGDDDRFTLVFPSGKY